MSDLRLRPSGPPFYLPVEFNVTNEMVALAKSAWSKRDDMLVFTDLLSSEGVLQPLSEEELCESGRLTYANVRDSAMYRLETAAREWIVDKLFANLNWELRVNGNWPDIRYVVIRKGSYGRLTQREMRKHFGNKTVTQRRLLVA